MPGQKARIKVDAFPDLTLSGEVIDVAPLPDPTSIFNSDIKVYTTRIRIDGNTGYLRPGLSAQAEILVLERDNALSVPVQALLQYDGKEHVAVKQPDGGFEWRDVSLGDANDTEVEVKEGINPGDHVALDPTHLLAEETRQKIFPTPPASRKDAGADRAKGKSSGNAASKRALSPTMIEKMRNIAPEDRARMKGAGQEVRDAILKKAGFTDAELRQLSEMRKQRGGPN